MLGLMVLLLEMQQIMEYFVNLQVVKQVTSELIIVLFIEDPGQHPLPTGHIGDVGDAAPVTIVDILGEHLETLGVAMEAMAVFHPRQARHNALSMRSRRISAM